MGYLRIFVMLIVGVAASHAAWGQGYPNKPVRIVVPFAAGSATDIVARLIADELKTATEVHAFAKAIGLSLSLSRRCALTIPSPDEHPASSAPAAAGTNPAETQ